MRKLKTKQIIFRGSGFLALVVILGATGFATPLCIAPATATVALQLTNGLTTQTICDSNSGLDSNTMNGAITYNGSVSNWTLNVATGVGTPLNTLGTLDLQSVDSTSIGNPGALIIKFSERNVGQLIPHFDMDFGATLKNSMVQYSVYYSNTDNYFATTTLIGSIGPFSFTSLNPNLSHAFHGDLFNLPAGGELLSPDYSITEVLTITPLGTLKHSFSGDALLSPSVPVTITNVPEPSSLLLLSAGLALAGIEIGRRRLLRKS